MKLLEMPRSAVVEITANKTRCALTCVSLSIGVAAILFTFSQVATMNKRVRLGTELAGKGRIGIWSRDGYVRKGLSRGLTVEDAEALRDAFPSLYMVYPLVNLGGARIRFDDFHTEGANVIGTTPDWAKRDWVYELRGRFLSQDDVRKTARVCVLVQPGGWGKGRKPRWAKFSKEQDLEGPLKRREMVGKRIQIGDHIFTVIGVIKSPPRDKDPRWFRSIYSSGGGTAMIPITTYQRYFLQPDQQAGGQTIADEIEIDTGAEINDGIWARRIETFMHARHRGEKDFELMDFRKRIQGALKRNREAALGVLVIGIVAILTGGIGIMNVTLATIFSRVREIGIRRALGATRFDIVAQFTTEAMALGLLGGAAGLPLGLAAVKYLTTDPDHLVMPGTLDLGLALAISIGTGFVFSIYPAWKASQLDPIEALRYE
ncbi:MAG: ABC transporter permease [Elusimicrobia bacterium]|nr:ABC transporter permease [Elusimicrobiota bacterium]